MNIVIQLIVAVTMLGFMHGMRQYGLESKYLSAEWHQNKDSITQVMLRTTGKVDHKKRRELCIELQTPILIKLGYMKDTTDTFFEPPL